MRAGIAGVVIAALAGAARPAAAQSEAPPPPPISVERVQRGLQRQPALDLPGQRPTFSVSITETLQFDNPFGVEKPNGPSWSDRVNKTIGTGVASIIALSAVAATMKGDGSMSAKPLVLMNLVAVGTLVASNVGRSLHARKLRTTRERVQDELEEFCATNGCVAPPAP